MFYHRLIDIRCHYFLTLRRLAFLLFIAGGFHVASGLGTLTKYRNRRGKDEVRIVLMGASRDPQLKPEEDEIGTADLILKVPAPKRRHGTRKGVRKAPKKATPKP